jgi:hypothetical protein
MTSPDIGKQESSIAYESSIKMNVPSERRRLLYCSSVSPQPVADGRLLVYRHLSRLYSHDRLLVVPSCSPPSQQLSMAASSPVLPASIWLRRLRRGVLYPLGDRLLANRVIQHCELVCNQYLPDVVVSVFLPDTYMTAAAGFARKHQLPLVLLCHDDYEDSTPASFHPTLAKIYRQASARLCVSQPMVHEFQKRYGAKGIVLLPIPSGPAQQPLPQATQTPLRIGFAGNICSGYQTALLQLANSLSQLGGRLCIASHSSRNTMNRVWTHPAVIDLGSLAPEQVRQAFVDAGVNVLAVVQSFDPQDERAFRYNFPSKLTEYSTFGLPLLIVAPVSASAFVWAGKHANVAAVTTNLAEGLTETVHSLNNAGTRASLAENFYKAAMEFDPEKQQAIFEAALHARKL